MEKALTVMLYLLMFPVIFLAAGALNIGAEPSAVINIEFYQMNFNFDGSIYSNTEWGSVCLTYIGQGPMMYFNLAVNGSWQIQNIPVQSGRGLCVEQNMTYFFDLGSERGIDVTSLSHGYSFTSYVLDTMPSGSDPASVWDDDVELWAGFEAGVMPDLAEARPLIGGEVNPGEKHAHKNFPNQEVGKKECVPGAVSNSLQFLNAKHNLGLAANKISIAEMKKAVGFVAGWGAPLDTWWELKKKYMEDNNYNITTRKITDMSKLAAEIDAGQDVEITESWIDKNGKRTGHVSALVGILPLEDGRYSLDISDDGKQGKEGGTEKPTSYTYDPKTRKFSHKNGVTSKFEYAIVECPVEIIGGVTIQVDTSAPMFMAYVGLSSAILAAVVAASIYAKSAKHRKDKE